MAVAPTFRVVFPDWYDERAEHEAEAKGWLQGVEVHFANGAMHSLFFYDPVRLAQDLDAEAKAGKPFIAQPGLIVIPEISRQAIVTAVTKLTEADYFENLSNGSAGHHTTVPAAEGQVSVPAPRVRVP
jgi:hypothetical protein